MCPRRCILGAPRRAATHLGAAFDRSPALSSLHSGGLSTQRSRTAKVGKYRLPPHGFTLRGTRRNKCAHAQHCEPSLHAANPPTRRSKPRDSHATRSTLCYRSRCYTGYRDLERPPEMTAATNSSAHSPAPCHSSPRGSSSRQYRWGISLDHRVGHILGGTLEDEDDLVRMVSRVRQVRQVEVV